MPATKCQCKKCDCKVMITFLQSLLYYSCICDACEDNKHKENKIS